MRRNPFREIRLEQFESRLLLAARPIADNAEDFGPASLVGRAFEDLDASAQDEGEPSMMGVRIQLFRDGGDGRFGTDGWGANAGAGLDGDDDRLSATVESASSGRFGFEDVEPGTYFVRQTVPAGFLLTTDNSFYSPGLFTKNLKNR